MYYRRYKDGSVMDWSAVKYSDDCIYSDGEIIKAWDGLTYIKGEEPPEPRELIKNFVALSPNVGTPFSKCLTLSVESRITGIDVAANT